MDEAVIEIKDLVVEYGDKRALNGLSLSVRRGQIFGFLGPNGAGKSTTIKTLLGLVFPCSGTVLIHGKKPSEPGARSPIGFLPEEATYYRFLTPLEILNFYGRICGVDCVSLKKKIQELLERVGLWSVRNNRIGTFSKGMSQKLGLAQCLIHDPDTLILDEPTSGLDPLARMDLRVLLNELHQKGKTIFFSSHELSEVELLCDTVSILKDGRIVKMGPMQDVLDSKNESLERFFIRTIGGSV